MAYNWTEIARHTRKSRGLGPLGARWPEQRRSGGEDRLRSHAFRARNPIPTRSRDALLLLSKASVWLPLGTAIALDKLGSIRRLRWSIKTDCLRGTLGGALLTESSLPY